MNQATTHPLYATYRAELANILERLAANIRETDFTEEVDESCNLRDENGNVVGSYELRYDATEN